jgi:hypothetical protein
MTASCTAEVGGLGIVSNHAYTFISEHLLSNGAKVFKLRNPWGQSEWTGAYRDADPFWTANPIDASNVGFLNKNDGTFFMTVADFKIQFSSLNFTYDSSNWKLSYWMARGNGDTIGVAGI